MCIERGFQGLVLYPLLACLKDSHFQAPCTTVEAGSQCNHSDKGLASFLHWTVLGLKMRLQLHAAAAHCLQLRKHLLGKECWEFPLSTMSAHLAWAWPVPWESSGYSWSRVEFGSLSREPGGLLSCSKASVEQA